MVTYYFVCIHVSTTYRMAYQVHKLTARRCASLTHSGQPRRHNKLGDEFHHDGLGLYLRVRPSGAKAWVQRLVVNGRRRWFGVGGYPVVTLKEARKRALENKRAAEAGEDPRALRARPGIPTFRDAAATVIDLHAKSWKARSKSRAQWESSLAAYACPKLGHLRVDRITTADVLAVVTPIWDTKRETASRVRQRISAIMRWAIAEGHRADDPASKAVLQALPKGTGRVQRHHRTLPYAEVPSAVQLVRDSSAWVATKLAFEFLVLTATRSGEVRHATWYEIDLDAATWTIPPERMKAKQEHRVPLAPRCLDILAEARVLTDPATPYMLPLAECPLVFPSPRGKALSDNTLSKLMRGLDIPAVPHGMRSAFRVWASERTTAPHAVMEAALAHTIRNKSEAAYARSDLFEKRRSLMDGWAQHVTRAPGDVVSIAG